MSLDLQNMKNMPIGRRRLLQAVGMSAFGVSASGWLPALADEIAGNPKRRRHCVLLWMPGGPSQMDTFDMKPDHANGGQFKEIATKSPGLRFSEHLPKLAEMADKIAVIRSLSTKEGDHGRGTYLMRTGQLPGGPLPYPAIGSALSKELGHQDAELPNYVSIAPFSGFNPAAFSSGFLGPNYAALTVAEQARPQASPDSDPAKGFTELGVEFLKRPAGVTAAQADSRRQLWRSLQNSFLTSRGSGSPVAQHTVYQRAIRMMESKAASAFDLSKESDKVRSSYGTSRFGQGCLMARRLIEQDVPFVEVSLGSFGNGGAAWDTHLNNFPAVRDLSTQLDTGWATLMRELDERGLLESTTFLWMGEFGRTPAINNNAGRDHFPAAWSCVLAGGGIKGGQAYGKTSEDGTEVIDKKVGVVDVLATLCAALGVDPATENITTIGRPIKISEGNPIKEILS